MKVADYIAEFLVDKGTDTAFVFTGGAIAHVIDSIGKNHPKIKYYCVQHEQVGAIAAEAYSRTTGKMGVAVATSGPGATNLITGIVGAHYDCIPALYLTGQVRTWELTKEDRLLQRGFQEVDIVSMVKNVTKYAVTVEKKEDIRYHLEKAFHLATSGRPGPVLLDLPMDIQFSDIDPIDLKQYTIPENSEDQADREWTKKLESLLKDSTKPLIIAGGGIRHANATNTFREIIEKLEIPVVLSYAAKDLLPTDHPLNCGVMGQFGQSNANIITQSADLIIGLGTRFNIRQAGNDTKQFAPNAKKIIVNIDEGELADGRLENPDLSINIDLNLFLSTLGGISMSCPSEWINDCQQTVDQYLNKEFSQQASDKIDPYRFFRVLSEKVQEDSIIIPDAGQNVITPSQAFNIKGQQRFFSSWGNSPMGYSFPASIGAQLGSPEKQVVAIIGDGGIQINMQDMQTIRFYNIPVKIFIVNNSVYGAILEFQDADLGKRYEATDIEHGYSHPNFEALAKAYEIPFYKINTHDDFNNIDKCLETSGPAICEVMVEEDFRIISPSQKPDQPLAID
jgi:acetolactate synthase I/II/III large subunit